MSLSKGIQPTMGNLVQRLRRSLTPVRANETVPISFTDWAKMFAPGNGVNYQGRNYPSFNLSSTPGSDSSIVYTCEAKRVSVFSEARFAWQRIRNGRPMPGALFGTDALSVLEEPWIGATTRDLLAVCELDVAYYGNSYWTIDQWSIPGKVMLVRIDPRNVKPLTQASYDPVNGNRFGEFLIGYGAVVDNKSIIFSPEDIAHYKPIPLPGNQWVGQSWISACLPDVEVDREITAHKNATVKNGANLTHVISMDPNIDPLEFDLFVEKFNEKHTGPQQAGKTLFIQGGTDVKTVGQSWESLSLRATQGAGETRVAAAAGTHPVILGLSEGLAGSALNAGNYSAAKRNFVDGTMCPLWGTWVGSFASLVSKPGRDTRLWYDARDIPFLREDITDLAAVLTQNATVINILVTAGFEPDAVIEAVYAGDVSGLIGQHNGLPSVQQQNVTSPRNLDQEFILALSERITN